MKIDKDYRLRNAEGSDHAFIMNSWIHQTGATLFSTGASNWASHQHRRIKKLFDRESLRIKVACALDDEDEIYGFIVGESDAGIAHFCYVKAAYQRWGIGSTLYRFMFGDGIVVCTMRSRDVHAMGKEGKLPPNLTYNPYWFEEQL